MALSFPATRVTIWDDLECDGGTELATVTRLVEGEAELLIGKAGELILATERDAEWLDEVDVLGVIRTELLSGLTVEWRIAGLETERGASAPTVVTADPIEADMGDRAFLADIRTGGITHYNLGSLEALSPDNWIDTVVLPSLTAKGITYITKGTVEFTGKHSLSWDRWTPHQLMDALADAVGGEWRLRRNGSTDYKIDLLEEIGSTATEVVIAEHRNLVRFRRSRSRENYATVLVPAGKQPSGAQERAGIGLASWEVVSAGGGSVVLKDRDGGSGPAVFADQFNGHYLLKPDGTLTEITDTVVTSSTQTTLTVADATGLSAGDDVEIRADSDGTLLTELVRPSLKRVVGTYDDSNLRGERNYTPNPFGTDWATQGDSVYCQVDGNQSGTSSLDIKSAPASQDFSTDDVLWLVIGGAMEVRWLTADTTATAGGLATLSLNAAVTVSDNAELAVFHTPSPPDDWTRVTPDTDIDQAACLHRDPDDTDQLSGALDGAVSTGEIDLKGLTANAKVYPGDVLEITSGSAVGTKRTILGPATVAGDGTVTVHTEGTIGSTADNDTVTVSRPPFAARKFTNAIALLPGSENADPPVIQTPTITVPAVDGISTVRASVGLTVYAGAGDALLDNGVGVRQPKIELYNVDTATVLDTATVESQTVTEGSEINVTLRASADFTADAQLAVRIWGTTSDGSTIKADPVVYVRHVMLYLGTDPEVPPVWGSHATPLHQDGNMRLVERSEWASEYELTIRELVEYWDLDPAEPSIELGGTLHVVIPSDEFDTTLRVVKVVYDLLRPENTRVTLSTRFEGVSEITARQKPRSVFVELRNADGESQGTTIADDTPPTTVGTRRVVEEDGTLLFTDTTPALLGGG